MYPRGIRLAAACILISFMVGCAGSDQRALTDGGPRNAPAGAAQATPTVTPDTPPSPEPAPPASAEGAPPSTQPAATPAPEATDAIALYPFLPAGGRPRVVVLDPGHGGPEVGAAGAGLAEKDVNLRIAFKLKDLLEGDGMDVVMVRDGDRRAVPPPGLEPPENWSAARKDLQARLDIANRAGGDVYISIHNNGSGDPGQHGTEVWWDSRRPFAAYNKALAELVLNGVVESIRAAGYPTVNRGLQEDSNFRVFRGRTFPIFVLGPPRTGVATTRAANMPAALGESLFLSNPAEAPFLGREDTLNAIARGYHTAIMRYFALIDGGALALPPEGLPPETPNVYDIQGPPLQGSPTPAPR